MADFDKFLKNKVAGTGAPAPAPAPAQPAFTAPAPRPAAPAPMSTSMPAPSAFGRANAWQPGLRPDPGSVWGRVERALFDVYQAFHDACRRGGFEAYVGRSNLFEYPYSVLFECWIPVNSGDHFFTERVSARVMLVTMPYHTFEIEYHVFIEDRSKEKKLGAYSALNSHDIDQLVTHLIKRTPEPKFSSTKIDPNAEGIFSSAKKNEFVGTKKSLLRLLIGWVPIFGPLICWIADLIASWRGLAVRSSGKPEREPRTLVLYDSWQAVIFGAGGSLAKFRADFDRAASSAPIPGLHFVPERIQYRRMDTVEEREQLVLTAGRGVIYCQVYQFGADLYVSWQSFLNRGRWVEQKLGIGRDTATGRMTEVRTVVPGTQALSEYDVMDLNCLTEWTHAQFVALTRQLIKDLRIDQEIDFKIVRGARSNLNQSEQAQPEGNAAPGGTQAPTFGFRRKA